MRVKLLNIYHSVRTSMWLIPTLMSAGALLLAVLSRQFDARVLRAEGASFDDKWFIYTGDISGAQTLLSTIAGSMITVAGVVFSVTMVALSFTSSQFGPRLLVNFMRDAANQLVLGTFIATFLYCLLAIGVEVPESPMPDYKTSAVTIALILSACSLAMLIYFFHHVASSLRAENVIDTVVQNLFASVALLTPREDSDRNRSDREAAKDSTPGAHHAVVAANPGYLQAVDEDGLTAVAREYDLVIQTLVRPGHFVSRDDPLSRLSVEPEDEERDQRIRDCFIIGRFRSDEQDPEFGISQLVEVALRALSPGINDPQTAITCVDWLGAIVASVATEPFRAGRRCDKNGDLRLILETVTFEGLINAAFNEIRQHSADHPAVSLRLLEALDRIAGIIDRGMPDRVDALRKHARALYDSAKQHAFPDIDAREFDTRFESIERHLEN